jgi:superfamily II DNA or RNA helicase
MAPRKAGSAKVEAVMERLETKLDYLKEASDKNASVVNGQLEKIDNRLDRLDIVSEKQQLILDEHVRRTNLLEAKVENDRKEIEKKIDERSAITEELKRDSEKVKLVMKIIGSVIGSGAAVGGASLGVTKLIALIMG